MAAAATAAALHEGGLLCQDLQRLLQALDLGLAARLPLLVGLRLCDAALFDLPVVLEHRRELRVRGLA
eukprot:CAMPEP_0176201040 /NCGR_PEP_ID=MMETSP0121_2-20121125/9364_1 /TAXON_ID=160619 /ORGANISM="Kryptoperidinium foliaceum, Strain CCMP 1326" /LENGTH=67 /DNA_ID=CAMNT_0017539911 /DNA_START=94 /DNA_END=294 /DNA_ORIENTATION=+